MQDKKNDLPESLDLKAVLQLLRHVPPGSPIFERCRGLLADTLEIAPAIPPRSALKKRKFLTIGMATASDYDGVYFTIQAIRLYHPEVLDYVNFVVIDNAPEGPCGVALKDFEYWANEDYRYIPYRTHRGTAVRDLVFREATGDFVLCVDSHVMFAPGSLARLIRYCKENPRSNDLLQGPLLDDKMEFMGMQFDPVWSNGMFGTWGLDARGNDIDGPPFEIEMQGLGVFGCRREAWPGFNPRLAGFGGEEGYIHEKIRRAGGRNLCLPFLRWLHRFQRPFGGKYPNTWEGRIRNYMLICDELGLDPAPMVSHFEKHVGMEPTREAVRRAQVEIDGPFHAFDAVFAINLDGRGERWNALQGRFREFGIDSLVRRFSSADTPLDRRIGRVLSHRRIVAAAKLQRLQMIVVFEDDNEFPPDAVAQIGSSLRELPKMQWQVAFLDGPGIAYHQTVFDAILNAIPDDPFAVARLVRDLPEDSGRTMQELLRGFGVGASQEDAGAVASKTPVPAFA